MRYVYPFDHKHRKPPMSMKDLLGGKGANLAEMTSVLGLPVPPGFTITTDACRAYMQGGWPEGLSDEIDRHLRKLEKAMGRALRDLADEFKDIVKKHTKKAFPQDPQEQLKGAVEAVFRSWNGPRAKAYRVRERIPHDLGTAVNVQAMVFGNRDDNSGTGVGFTRDPATGAQGAYGDFLVNAQGEDVVAGIRNTEPLAALEGRFPKIYKELLSIFERLERHYRDMCDTEFTIDQGKLWMLQTRVGKRTGAAALKMAVDLTTDRRTKLSPAEAGH